MKRILFLLLLLPALLLTACGGDDPDPTLSPDMAETISFRDLRILFVDSLDTNLTDRTQVSVINRNDNSPVPFTLETFRDRRCIRFAATEHPVEVVVNGSRSLYIHSINAVEMVGTRMKITRHYLYNGVNTGDSVATFLCTRDYVLLRHYAPELKFRLILPRVRTDLIPKDNPCRLSVNVNGGGIWGMAETQGRFISMDATPLDDTYSKVTLLMGADVLCGNDGYNHLNNNSPRFTFDSRLFPFDDHRFEIIVNYNENLYSDVYKRPRFQIQRINTEIDGVFSAIRDITQVVKNDNTIELEVKKPITEWPATEALH